MVNRESERHPQHGGRFVLERAHDRSGLCYLARAHLADGSTLETMLELLQPEGIHFDPELEDHAWAREQLIKLARVLRRDPKHRLSRWRG